MAAGGPPALQVVHILSRPPHEWEGETGHLDDEKLERLCGPRLKTSLFFLCCPPALLRGLVPILVELGVPYERISYEYFSL